YAEPRRLVPPPSVRRACPKPTTLRVPQSADRRRRFVAYRPAVPSRPRAPRRKCAPPVSRHYQRQAARAPQFELPTVSKLIGAPAWHLASPPVEVHIPSDDRVV